MDARLAQFVKGMYLELQTIEGVKPLEIWSGFREMQEPYECAGLVKNLYKIVVPLVNERCYGRPFPEHSRLAYETVGALLRLFSADLDAMIFERFPWPPTGDADQKELYRVVKARAAAALADIDADPPPPRESAPGGKDSASVPDGLFDFREMRLVDNELPYIIFTDKEFRVIHGLAVVYLWLIDLDGTYCATLESLGTDPTLVEEYRKFVGTVHRESPLTFRGRKMDARELSAHIHEKLKYEDYLDLFENVYRWFESTRDRLGAR